MKYNCIIIYLLLFLISISAISCEKETVITISNESFEEYFPYHENGKSYNEPFRYVGKDKTYGFPVWRSLYEINESGNRCSLEFIDNKGYGGQTPEETRLPSLSLLQEWNYLKERPQDYGVDAFHIVAYFTFTYENINGNYYIKNYHYTTDARIFGMNYLEFDSSNGKIGRWVHKK